jgi:hypothetical protein
MITKTQPGTPPKAVKEISGKPGQEEEKTSPQEMGLLRQKEQIEKRLERVQKQKQAGNVVRSFIKTAQPNPNDDPIALFEQISPTLDKMGIKNDTDRRKVELVIGKSNAKKENMYKIPLRRTAEITPDTISKLNRNVDSLSAIIWTSKNMEAYVWGPYAPPAEEGVPEGEPEGIV